MRLEPHPHHRDRILTVLEPIMARSLRADVRFALTELHRRGLSLEHALGTLDSNDPTALAWLYLAVDQLDAAGVLCRTVVDARARPLITIEPLRATPPYAATEISDDKILALSPYAFARRDLDEVVVEIPTGRARVRFRDPQCGILLSLLSAPIRYRVLRQRLPKRLRARANELVGALVYCGVVEDTADAPSKGFRRECWEFHDLLFHARSRDGWHDTRYGGTYRFRGYSEPSPTLKPSPPGERTALPSSAAKGELSEILATRRSARSAPESLTLEELGTLLWHAARIRVCSDSPDGMMTTRRPYPSGGASYPLEVYLVVGRCRDLARGTYYYDGVKHELVRVADSTDSLPEAMRAAGIETAPDALVVLTARFRRVAWKYEGIAYGLVLKEVGALMQTFCLTATALGIGACPLGNGHGVRFCESVGLDYAVESPVGELLLVGMQGNAT